MAAIFETTFSNAFYGMKMYERPIHNIADIGSENGLTPTSHLMNQ